MNMNLELLGPLIGPLLLIMATLASCVLVTLKMLDKRTERKNGGSTRRPKIEETAGHGPMCGDHDRAIERIVTSQEYQAADTKEIKTTMGKIWDKLDAD